MNTLDRKLVDMIQRQNHSIRNISEQIFKLENVTKFENRILFDMIQSQFLLIQNISMRLSKLENNNNDKGNKTCEHADRLYANPGCRTFYQCVDQRVFTFNCPAGTLFDEAAQLCNYANLVKCSK